MINLKELHRLTSAIPADIGGGSSFEKLSVMAFLADTLKLRTFIEIGVYRGRSFFPLASFFARHKGFSYGVDPYTVADAREEDLPNDIVDAVNKFFAETDYDALYREVLLRQSEFRVAQNSKIIRQTSRLAAQYFSGLSVTADMIHIDGNHDTKFVMEDVDLYLKFLKSSGVLVLDDIDWPSVKPALAFVKERLTLIHLADTYAVFVNSRLMQEEVERLSALCTQVETEARSLDANPGLFPKVSVSIITYNQEAYIAQAIESALSQKADFEIEIVIGEDHSTDATLSICRDYQTRFPDKIRLLERDRNVGAVKNYLDTYSACRGEYVAFLEGDDFFIDAQKLKKQVEFLDENQDYAICFHNVYLADKEGQLGKPLFDSLPDTSTVDELCTGEFISTPSCMIRNKQVSEIPDWIYNLPGCDWPFDILNAECGKIKCLSGLMAAYRRHDASMWSSLNAIQQHTLAISLATELILRLDRRYEKDLRHYISKNYVALLVHQANEKAMADKRAARSAFRNWISDALRRVKAPIKRRRLAAKTKLKSLISKPKLFDFLIVDDAYPHPQSAFRLEEYDCYLKYFRNAAVHTSGKAFPYFNEKRPLRDIVAEQMKNDPIRKGKISIFNEEKPVRARLAYAIFAGNAWEQVEYFERNRLPFLFTLYPGGSFYMNDDASDERLRRVFNSPMFRRVITTQEITKNYLLEKGFCDPKKIEFIYGVVTPTKNLVAPIDEHVRYGFGKETLDICFTAHKYTANGHDKGFDLFLEVAKRLVAEFSDVRFHVVGGFGAEDLPTEGLEGKITFYGRQNQEWLAEFYKDKDVILLANVPNIIAKGAFDGFPTGCGSDAMLNGVSLFCTDPLKMNYKFVDGRDLVIIPHDVNKVIERLTYYRDKPDALKALSEAGKLQASKIYSFESQMKPRIDIIEREIRRTSAAF